jgi:hypothetical protein
LLSRLRTAALLATACFFAAAAARAEIKLEPGTWQQVESGIENGEPAEPVTYVDCLTPEVAKDPIKAMSNLKEMGQLIGRQCQELDAHQGTDMISVKFACGDETTNFVGLSLEFKFVDPRRYTGTVKSTFVFKGSKTTSDKTIEAKWLKAACDKNSSAPDQPQH